MSDRCKNCSSITFLETLNGTVCAECGFVVGSAPTDESWDNLFQPVSVELVRHTGDDLSVVQRAKQTYDDMPDEWEGSMENIIRYMMWNNHGTPFEEPDFSFKIQLPIWAARQLVKYRMSTWNEYSRRYNDDDLIFHDYRLRKDEDKRHKQGSGEIIHHQTEKGQMLYGKVDEFFEMSRKLYRELINEGVSPETARVVQPVGSMTSVTWKMNFRSLMNIMDQRLDFHAQTVTREIVGKMYEIVKDLLPVNMRAWEDKNEIMTTVRESLYKFYKKGSATSSRIAEEINIFFENDDMWLRRILNFVETFTRGKERNRLIDELIYELKEMKI